MTQRYREPLHTTDWREAKERDKERRHSPFTAACGIILLSDPSLVAAADRTPAVTTQVASCPPCHRRSLAMFKHILIPTDGSPIAIKAVRAGIRFAHEIGAKVTAYQAIGTLLTHIDEEGYVVESQNARRI
jgi:hypothetical protein